MHQTGVQPRRARESAPVIAGRPSDHATRAADHPRTAFDRHLVLRLLGGFHLELDAASVPVSRVGQRVLACLALHDRRQPRSALAGRLWPEVGEERASARLRTALWRLPDQPGLLEVGIDQGVALGPDVAVDVEDLVEVARRWVDRPDGVDGEVPSVLTDARELLPDWDDDWVVPDRERIRQLRLHALEELSNRLATEGRFGRAIEIGLALIADDPLRESARRTLIRIHALEGNVHDAIEQFEAYRRIMRDELALEPSPRMDALMDELGLARRRASRSNGTRRNGGPHGGRRDAAVTPTRRGRDGAAAEP